MKSAKHHQYNFTVLIEQDEDGYFVATVPALKSCYTQAKKLEDIPALVREVIELCLQEEKPKVMKFTGLQQMLVAV